MAALFVYGTLRDPECLHSLIGRQPACQPAWLEGFRVVRPIGGYPFLVPSEAAMTDGLVLRGLTEPEMIRLDEYEGEGTLYRRMRVEVRVGPEREEAFTYVAIPDAHPVPVEP